MLTLFHLLIYNTACIAGLFVCIEKIIIYSVIYFTPPSVNINIK